MIIKAAITDRTQRETTLSLISKDGTKSHVTIPNKEFENFLQHVLHAQLDGDHVVFRGSGSHHELDLEGKIIPRTTLP